MFSFLTRKRRSNRYLGICFHHKFVSLAVVTGDQQQGFAIEHIACQDALTPEDKQQVVVQMVKDARLKGMPVVVVLESGQYSLLQVERPEVTAEEMKSAVRWRIKDMIDFHVDDAVIDLVNLPESKRVGAPKLMYVIAVRRSLVQSVVDAVEEAGLEVQAIDITELALRNLTYAENQEERSSAFLYLTREKSLIEICDTGTLYMSRPITLDIDRMDTITGDDRNEAMDMLALEVQRSLDYYESQFANGSVSQVYLVSECLSTIDDFVSVAESYLTVPVKMMSTIDELAGSSSMDKGLVVRALPAVGGALRDVVWKA